MSLAASDAHLSFEVEDDGVGFDPAAHPYGTGLQGMADRLDALGGELEVRSASGSGTTVIGRLPIPWGVWERTDLVMVVLGAVGLAPYIASQALGGRTR